MSTLLNLLRAPIITAAVLTGSGASGEVLFSTMPTGTFNTTQGWVVQTGQQQVAVRFTIAQTRLLTSVTLPMFSSGVPATVAGRIADGSQTTPGSTVVDLNIPTVGAAAAYIATPATPTILRPGTYFVHLTGAGPVARWNWNNLFLSNPYVIFTNNTWFQLNDQMVPAVQINGEAVAACCSATTANCVVLDVQACDTLGLRAGGTTCSPNACRPCPGDFNRSGGITVQDIFDFLTAYFAGCP